MSTQAIGNSSITFTLENWKEALVTRPAISSNDVMRPIVDAQDPNIRILAIASIIGAIAAVVLAASGFALKMSALYMGAIAVSAIALLLLGIRCYLQFVLNQSNRERRDVRAVQTQYNVPFPSENNEIDRNDRIVVRQLVLASMRQEMNQRARLIQALCAEVHNEECEERTALDWVINNLPVTASQEISRYLKACREKQDVTELQSLLQNRVLNLWNESLYGAARRGDTIAMH